MSQTNPKDMATKRQPRTAQPAQREPRNAKRNPTVSTNRTTVSINSTTVSINRTTVSVIGAGRLGTALARALAACGYTIEAVVARQLKHARRAARLSGAQPRALTFKQLSQLPNSDLFIITTPDDAIASTAAQLAAIFRARTNAHTALHASGALSSDALKDLRGAGFAVGSLHPLISVSDSAQGAASLSEAFYCIEGESKAVRLARRIVRDIGGQSFSVSAEDKALYHAAAVMASGHFTALFDIASEMLARCGLTEKRARAVLLPLVRSTVENLATHEPAAALTGTFARADLATMRRHLDAIRARSTNEALAAYVLLGQRSLQLAEQNDVSKAALKEMARVLKSKG
jgi:predicted short-subunit dehydrogenase-like oxidoreductase (DUF2520 family)